MTAPSRIEINQIALDPCGPSTHDNARLIPRGLVNHTVGLLRRIDAASYFGQFVTRFLALGTLWRRLSLNLYGISFHNERLGWTDYPTVRPAASSSIQAL
jgi:hypothetical protein